MEPEKHRNIPSVNPDLSSYFWLQDYTLKDNRYLVSFKSKDYHYLIRVRRFKANDKFIIRIEDDFLKVHIESISKGQDLILKIDDKVVLNSYTSNKIIVLAMIDHYRLDLVIEKLTELGCLKLILLKTDYSQSLSIDLFNRKIRHWQALSRAACMQSGRSNLLDIECKMSFADLYDQYSNLVILDHHSSLLLSNALLDSSIAVIGPEGGFSDKERLWFSKSHITTVKMDGNILRSETAAIIMARST